MKNFHHILNNIDPPKLEQVTIDGVRYYNTPDGRPLPSVTTVISETNFEKKKILKKWRENIGDVEANRITNNASSRGKKLHKACELYLKNDPSFSHGMMPDVKYMFNSILPFLHKINNIHYIERPLFSYRLGLAGTVDIIAEYDGILSVIDLKNSRRLRKPEHIQNYFLQETAYALIYNEFKNFSMVKQIVTIMAVEDEKPQIFIERPSKYVKELISCVKLYQRMKSENKSEV